MSDATPSRPSADRNLLFGILALQMDFITRDALIAAMHAWVLDKAKPLGQVMFEQGAIRAENGDLLDVLISRHLEMHGDDVEKSLAALGVPAPLRQELHSLGDGDVDASLARVPTPLHAPSQMESTTAEKPGQSGLRYHVLRPHGKGGLGEVFVALDQELNREVALKEIQDQHADDQHSRGRFVREAEITGGLEHPGIVPVYGLGQYGDGRPFYAMRFIQGETLKDAIARYHQARRRRQPPGPTSDDSRQPANAGRSPEFELRALLTRFVAVCNTIAYAHSRGVIHRDIKPSNIMLGKYGETLIVDWGLAKALSDSPAPVASDGLAEPVLVPRLTEIGETQAGAALGTPAYMSPEQAAGRVDLLGPASDIYSLGATLYTLLTGRAPIEGKETAELIRKAQRGEWLSARLVRSDVPPALDAICCKAMALKPEQRYAAALELAADVEHWLADEAVKAWPEPWTVRARRWIGRHRTAVSTAAAAVLVAFVASIAGVVLLAAAEKKEREAKEAQAAARKSAEDKEKEARHNLYVAEMNLVQKEYEANNINHVRELLAKWIPSEANPEDLRGFEWHFWHLRAHREPLTLKGHTGPVWCVCFSPDGKRLASASSDQTIRMWDSASGKELLTLKAHPRLVPVVCFSPDGTRLASASADQVKIWDSTSGKELLAIKAHKGQVNCVCFSPDGTRLATASSDQTVRIWDSTSGQEHLTLKGHTGWVISVCFSPDGVRLASASFDGTVRIWDSASGLELLSLKGHTRQVYGVCFSPDGRWVASSSGDLTVKVWDSTSGQELRTLRHSGRGGRPSVCFNPNGTRLASAIGGDRTVKVWDSTSGQELLTLQGHTGEVHGLCFSPDGMRVASASQDKTVKVWNSTSGQELLTLKGHTAILESVCFSPGGRWLASAAGQIGKPGEVKVWDSMSGQELVSLQGNTGDVKAICFSPDGTHIASAGGKLDNNYRPLPGEVRIWDSASGRQLLALKGHRGMVHAVAFSPGGTRLASGGGGNDEQNRPFAELKLWDSTSGRELQAFSGHADAVSGVCFSPDGVHLASASFDQTVRVWEATSGRELLTLQGHSGKVNSVAFSPDGSRLASASEDRTVRFWNSTSGQPIFTLQGHSGSVASVCFNSDGTRLVSVGGQLDTTGEIIVWDSRSGQELLRIKHPSYYNMRSACFSPDGTRLVAIVDSVGALKVWEIRPVSIDTLRKRAILETVQALYSRLLLKERVLREVRADRWLDENDRRFAVEVAQTQSEDPFWLNEAAWKVVRAPGGKKEDYGLALQEATAAVQAEPGNGSYLNTLGVAQFRAGEYSKAISTLTESEKLNAKSVHSPTARVGDIAFLALAQHQLGQKNEAQTTLARLRELLKQGHGFNETEAQGFLLEAEELIEGKPADKKN
jgi:WD40 repeat protein/serine/threonine protein kinase